MPTKRADVGRAPTKQAYPPHIEPGKVGGFSWPPEAPWSTGFEVTVEGRITTVIPAPEGRHAMYDYFVAELRCPGCGTINPTTAYTNLQTHIRGSGADGSELRVGTSLAPVYLTTEHLASAGHALITAPTAAGSIRLLDIWICP